MPSGYDQGTHNICYRDSLKDFKQSEFQSSLWSLGGEEAVGDRSGSTSAARILLAVVPAGDGHSLDQDGGSGGGESGKV